MGTDLQSIEQNELSYTIHSCFVENAKPTTCAPHEFTCPHSGKCISLAWVLDRVQDCPDGEDEHHGFVDECRAGRHICDIHASCQNIPGGTYQCTCTHPYVGDGLHCSLPPATLSTKAVRVPMTRIPPTDRSRLPYTRPPFTTPAPTVTIRKFVTHRTGIDCPRALGGDLQAGHCPPSSQNFFGAKQLFS